MTLKKLNNAVYGKTMENVRKIEILNLSQQKDEKTIWYQNQIIILQIFDRKCIINGNEKTEILINKPVSLGLSIL